MPAPIQASGLSGLRLRDPFILPDAAAGLYRLYGTTALGGREEAPGGFGMWTSRDLVAWDEAHPVLPRMAGPAAADFYWAPEVHAHQGRWYLFGSFGVGLDMLKPKAHYTAVYAADTPAGPFVQHAPAPLTPAGWNCIDGTLHVDARGHPWMVFVREWTQTLDGEMHAVRLSDDLRQPVGPPQLLFRASEAPWSLAQHSEYGEGYRVTDGPWLHRTADGSLLMFWSSFGAGGYLTGVARSVSGEVTGPWLQSPEALPLPDSGHAMTFRTFDDQLLLLLHSPNQPGHERARLRRLREVPGGLELAR